MYYVTWPKRLGRIAWAVNIHDGSGQFTTRAFWFRWSAMRFRAKCNNASKIFA